MNYIFINLFHSGFPLPLTRLCKFYDKLMQLIEAIVTTFIIVMTYRFIFRFVLPIYRATKTASDRMRQMKQQMDDMQTKANTNARPSNKPPQPKDGDYIDYEEVKP